MGVRGTLYELTETSVSYELEGPCAGFNMAERTDLLAAA